METTNQPLHLIDTPTLHAELRRVCTLSVDALKAAAPVFRELESRGESFPYIPRPLLACLRMVADGALEAEAALVYAMQPEKAAILAKLPKNIQREVAAAKPIPVATVVNGAVVVKDKPATKMTVAEFRRAFRDGRIVKPSEQVREIRPQQGGASEEMRSLRLTISAATMNGLMALATRQRRAVTDIAGELLDLAVASELEKSAS